PVITWTPLLRRSSAVSGVVPRPPAEFSALATTTSTLCSRTNSGRSARTRSRPGLPITSPMPRMRTELFGVVDRAGLSNHAHPHLAGIGGLGFDPLGDVLGEQTRLFIGDLRVLHQHAHLAAGLDCERLLHAGETFGQLFQIS